MSKDQNMENKMELQIKNNRWTEDNGDPIKWHARWNRISIDRSHEQCSRRIDKNLLGVYITVKCSYILSILIQLSSSSIAKNESTKKTKKKSNY